MNQTNINKTARDAQRKVRKQNQNFGRNTPTIICRDCGKRTRETGAGESELEMCAKCIEIAEWENSVSDGNAIQLEDGSFRFLTEQEKSEWRAALELKNQTYENSTK